MSLDREFLEIQALATISSENYYDLADTIDSLTDKDLQDLIDCNGNFDKENELSEFNLMIPEQERADEIVQMLRENGEYYK